MSAISNIRMPVTPPAAPAPEIINPVNEPPVDYVSRSALLGVVGLGAVGGGALAGLFTAVTPLGGVIFAVGAFASGLASAGVVQWLDCDPQGIMMKVMSCVAPIFAVIAGTAALAIAGFAVTPLAIGILTLGTAFGAGTLASLYIFGHTMAALGQAQS